MRNYVNLAVPTMPLLVADKRGAAETKIIAPRVFPRLNGTREAARQAVLAKMAQES
jgi:hypothetical protein